ncbi:MAG: DpnII family type II restriction endonuclease [Roseimicrobium sp.]
MLPSRQFDSPEAFVDAFLATLTPGIIPRADFIHWKNIDTKLQQHAAALSLFEEVAQKFRHGNEWQPLLSQALREAQHPHPIVDAAFELLGHTSAELVTRDDDLSINELARGLADRDGKTADRFVALLGALGFDHILAQSDLRAVFFGVQLGLEPNRRKNIGGDAFADALEHVLGGIVAGLAQHGLKLQLKREFTIRYGNGLSKKVDFALLQDGHTRVGFEVNFYTAAGSKPSEIKRSYGNVLEALRDEDVELLWITDGKGYRDMERSLRDAYVILPNIYNLHQAQQHLAEDLQAWLGK